MGGPGSPPEEQFHQFPVPRRRDFFLGVLLRNLDLEPTGPFTEETDEDAYAPKPELDGPTLVELVEHLLPMSENGFLREYADSPISRPAETVHVNRPER